MIRIALLLAAALPSAAHAQARPAATAPALVQRDHISIRDEGGTGPVVILIPGLSSPRAVWDGVVPALKADHHVLTVQVNGFAGDDPRANLKPGILDGIVADLSAEIAARKYGKPAVVGHSMGGLVGMMLTKAHPTQVGRLMIVDSLPYIGDLFFPGATVAQVEPQARAMRDGMAAAYGKPADLGVIAAAEGIANTLAATPAGRAQVKAWALATDPRVSAAAMYEDMTTDLRPDVASLTLPITLVYPAPGEAIYHRVYAAAPNVTYVPVADAAHFVMLDQPKAFEAALRTFLK
ncbi:alpha/beta fold hydrolase [Sphingomonas sp. RS2018]